MSRDSSVEAEPDPDASAPPRPLVPLALLWLAATLPTAAALLYFTVLDEHPAAPFVYAASKVVQFLLPLSALSALGVRPLRRSAARTTSARARTSRSAARVAPGAPARGDRPQVRPRIAPAVWYGAGSGLALASGVVVARLLLDSSPILHELSSAVAARMATYSLDGPGSYLAFALFLSFAHSGLEEYYWRWFLLGGLNRRGTASGPAVLLSSLAFTAHHVVVVAGFVPRGQAPLVVLGSAGVLVAGMVWAWLFLRWKGILAPWASHVLVDLAVLALGWELVSRTH